MDTYVVDIVVNDNIEIYPSAINREISRNRFSIGNCGDNVYTWPKKVEEIEGEKKRDKIKGWSVNRVRINVYFKVKSEI